MFEGRFLIPCQRAVYLLPHRHSVEISLHYPNRPRERPIVHSSSDEYDRHLSCELNSCYILHRSTGVIHLSTVWSRTHCHRRKIHARQFSTIVPDWGWTLESSELHLCRRRIEECRVLPAWTEEIEYWQNPVLVAALIQHYRKEADCRSTRLLDNRHSYFSASLCSMVDPLPDPKALWLDRSTLDRLPSACQRYLGLEWVGHESGQRRYRWRNRIHLRERFNDDVTNSPDADRTCNRRRHRATEQSISSNEVSERVIHYLNLVCDGWGSRAQRQLFLFSPIDKWKKNRIQRRSALLFELKRTRWEAIM